MTITEILGRAEQGMTWPFVCRGDDWMTYYVKAAYAGRRLLCCKWVANLLVGLMLPGAPLGVPFFKMAEVPEALIEGSMRKDARDLGAGLAFASRRMEGDLELTRDDGGQSYWDLERHLGKFIAALQKCTGYDTGAPTDIAIVTLTALQATLKTANDTVPEKEVALRDAQIERLRVFESNQPLPDGSASLRDRWVRIKKAVAAPYGRSSAEYALVQGLKY